MPLTLVWPLSSLPLLSVISVDYGKLTAIIGLGRHRVNAARNNLDYLVQMNIHRDGRTLDLFIQRANNQVSKIEVILMLIVRET